MLSQKYKHQTWHTMTHGGWYCCKVSDLMVETLNNPQLPMQKVEQGLKESAAWVEQTVDRLVSSDDTSHGCFCEQLLGV